MAALLLIGTGAPPRRMHVADFLHTCGFATLVTAFQANEDALRTGALERNSEQVSAAVAWLGDQSRLRNLPIGCMAEGAAVAPAIAAISAHGAQVGAFVAVNGRPDLAGPALAALGAPTLFITGEHSEALTFARAALARLPAAELVVIEAVADPLGDLEALGAVSRQARRWFQSWLPGPES